MVEVRNGHPLVSFMIKKAMGPKAPQSLTAGCPADAEASGQAFFATVAPGLMAADNNCSEYRRIDVCPLGL